MKMIMLILLLSGIHGVCISQYTVTKVIGQVSNKTTGESLHPGSKLRDDDMLAFSSPNDMLRVIVSGKGIYVISPGPKSEKQQNMLVEMLKSALKIKSREGYLSGRSEEEETVPTVLQTDAAVNKNNLIAAENKYLFDPRVYDISKGNRFFLQTQAEGGTPVIHALKTIADTLIISTIDFGNDQASISSTSYKLGFFSREKNSSELLAEIRPLLDSKGEMETIIRLIISENKEKDKTLAQQQCYAEVYEALGKPPALLFKNVFEKMWNQVVKPTN